MSLQVTWDSLSWLEPGDGNSKAGFLSLCGLKSWTWCVGPFQLRIFKQLKIPSSSQDLIFSLDLNIWITRVVLLQISHEIIPTPHSLYLNTLNIHFGLEVSAPLFQHPKPIQLPHLPKIPLMIFSESIWGSCSKPSAQGTAPPSALKVNIYFGRLLLLWRN